MSVTITHHSMRKMIRIRTYENKQVIIDDNKVMSANYGVERKRTFFPHRVEGQWTKEFWVVTVDKKVCAKFINKNDARMVQYYLYTLGIEL